MQATLSKCPAEIAIASQAIAASYPNPINVYNKVMQRWIEIENVQIDLNALRALAHTCDPMKCRHTKCCCRSYEVTVEREEIEKVAGTVPEAAQLAPALTEDGDLVDPIDETDHGYCLNTDEHGECVFAYRTDQGAIRCAMHTLALQWNLPPESVKPKACTLWPLAIHGTNPAQLSVQDDAYEFPCNTLRKTTVQSIDSGVADIIEAIFGRPFLQKLENVLMQG